MQLTTYWNARRGPKSNRNGHKPKGPGFIWITIIMDTATSSVTKCSKRQHQRSSTKNLQALLPKTDELLELPSACKAWQCSKGVRSKKSPTTVYHRSQEEEGEKIQHLPSLSMRQAACRCKKLRRALLQPTSSRIKEEDVQSLTETPQRVGRIKKPWVTTGNR